MDRPARSPRPGRRSLPAWAALLVAGAAAPAAAGDWPGFRGPAANGVVPGPALPVGWDGESNTNIAWRVAVPGEGWSQPVIAGGRLFLTAAVPEDPPAAEQNSGRRGGGYEDLTGTTYRYEVRCLDAATGAEQWVRTVRTGAPPLTRHRTNTYATETPVTDGRRVYALFGGTGLYALTVDGEPVWDAPVEAREMRAGWGTASSPALYGDKVFLQEDSQEKSTLRALDAATGEELWTVDRDEPSSYGSPVIWEAGGSAQLVVGGQVARGHDPATGEELWRLDMGLGRSSATPAPAGDVLLIGTEYRDRGGDDDGGGYLAAVAADARGDLGSVSAPGAGVKWATPRSGLQMASPAVAAGKIVLLERGGGIAHTLDLSTGGKLGRERLPAAAPFWASPLVSAGRVYALDESGATHVLDPAGGETFEVLARNDTPGLFWSAPAAADGRLYLRSSDELICVSQVP